MCLYYTQVQGIQVYIYSALNQLQGFLRAALDSSSEILYNLEECLPLYVRLHPVYEVTGKVNSSFTEIIDNNQILGKLFQGKEVWFGAPGGSGGQQPVLPFCEVQQVQDQPGVHTY